MSTSIVQHLKDYLGAQMEKIDPNTQSVNPDTRHHRYDLLAQASIPATLVSFYKYTRSAEGANQLASDNGKSDPFDLITGTHKGDVVFRVAKFAGVDEVQAEQVLDAVADETIRYYRNQLGSNMSPENLQQYFASQRQEILTHLPGELQMGELLNDDTLDDRTNKMRGPISNLAQRISGFMSSTGTDKE